MSHQTNEELQVLILIHSMNYLHYMLLWCARDISWRIPSDSLSFSGGTRLLGRDQTWVRWNVWHSQEPSSKANISLGKPSKPTQDDIHSHPRYSSGAEYQTQGNFQECTASLLEAQTMAYTGTILKKHEMTFASTKLSSEICSNWACSYWAHWARCRSNLANLMPLFHGVWCSKHQRTFGRTSLSNIGAPKEAWRLVTILKSLCT